MTRTARPSANVARVLLVRHGSAGSREEWVGDDRERPLDEKGVGQAARLADTLADVTVDRILTSPYLRCVQTVEPIAAELDIAFELRDELGEERQMTDGIALVRSLAGTAALICGHGGLEMSLVGPSRWKKGSVFVVDADLNVVEVRRP